MASLLRRRSESAPPVVEVQARPGAKGRPTPKRSDARAQRASAPSAAPARSGKTTSADRRAAALARRQALETTDVNRLPPDERTPSAILIRKVVDSRPSTTPLLFAAMVLEVIGGFDKSKTVKVDLVLVLYGALLLALLDNAWRVSQVRRALRRQLPDVIVKGAWLYAVKRAARPKRLRKPIPGI